MEGKSALSMSRMVPDKYSRNERTQAKPRERAVRREAQAHLPFFWQQKSRKLDLNILKYILNCGTVHILIQVSVPQVLRRDVG